MLCAEHSQFKKAWSVEEEMRNNPNNTLKEDLTLRCWLWQSTVMWLVQARYQWIGNIGRFSVLPRWRHMFRHYTLHNIHPTQHIPLTTHHSPHTTYAQHPASSHTSYRWVKLDPLPSHPSSGNSISSTDLKLEVIKWMTPTIHHLTLCRWPSAGPTTALWPFPASLASLS